MKCPNCGNELPVNAKFCQHCGTKIQPQKHCARCGAMLPFNAKFCEKCGAPVTVEPQDTTRRPTGKAFDPRATRSSHKMLISLLGLALLLAIFGIAFWYYIDKSNTKPKPTIEIYADNDVVEETTAQVKDILVEEMPEKKSRKEERHHPEIYKSSEAPAEAPARTSSHYDNYNSGIIYLKGKVNGKYPVNMKLNLDRSSGEYCYDKYGPTKSMELVITYHSGNQISMDEYSKGNYCGEWNGTLKNGVYSGTGTYHGKDMPFKLYVCDPSESSYY